MDNMNIGISSYAFTWAVGMAGSQPENPLNALDLIDIAKRLNVDNLQIADNIPLHLFSREKLEEIKTHADKQNINVEIGAKRMTPEVLSAYLKISTLFESPFLRIIIDDRDYEPPLEEIIAIVRNQITEFENEQVVLAIENHDRLKARELEDIIQKVGSNYLGICLDSVNSLGAGEGIETVTKILGKYTVNLHVKEFTAVRASHKMGFTIQGLPLGQGLLPLEWMLANINPSCFSAILEQWTPPGSSLEETIAREESWAVESVQLLKQIIKS